MEFLLDRNIFQIQNRKWVYAFVCVRKIFIVIWNIKEVELKNKNENRLNNNIFFGLIRRPRVVGPYSQHIHTKKRKHSGVVDPVDDSILISLILESISYDTIKYNENRRNSGCLR